MNLARGYNIGGIHVIILWSNPEPLKLALCLAFSQVSNIAWQCSTNHSRASQHCPSIFFPGGYRWREESGSFCTPGHKQDTTKGSQSLHEHIYVAYINTQHNALHPSHPLQSHIRVRQKIIRGSGGFGSRR